MEPDIAQFLSYEVKKELADRYFGFRKLIEEDKQSLAQKVWHHTVTMEQNICLDLVRIYILLQDDELIHRFLAVTGLEEKIYYDPYLLESPTIRKKVFEGMKARGWTRRGRFIHLVLDAYDILVQHVAKYIDSFGELLADQETIEEEIKLFYRRHDLGNIMGFLRALESSGAEKAVLDAGSGLCGLQGLEDKMRLEPPEPIEKCLPIIPPLVPLHSIRKNLKALARTAYAMQKKDFQVT